MRRMAASRTRCPARSRRRSRRSSRRSPCAPSARSPAATSRARTSVSTPRGKPVFLELNPLPTFARDGSFAVLAEILGRTLEDLLAEVLALGLARLGLA